MTSGQRYRIEFSTIAVMTQSEKRVATTIPKGEIVEVTEPPTQGSGLIRVRWNGQTVEMFTQDLLQRGQRMASVASS